MYRARFLLAGSLIGLCAAILSALALLPSYLALHSGGESTVPAETIERSADQADRSAIIRTQQLVSKLAPLVSASTTPTQTISRALAARPSDIGVDHIVYTAGAPGTLIIGGTARAREAVSAYRQALMGDSLWKSVMVPVGDLAGAPGARFSVTLSGDF